MSALKELIALGKTLELEKADSETLKELQTKLKELYYYTGEIDGIYGGFTADAWAQFKQDSHQADPTIIGPGSLKLLLAKPKRSQVPSQAIDLIKEFEGYSDTAYADDIWGWDVPTIGWGTIKYPNGSKVKRGDTCTVAQAQSWLEWEVDSLCTPSLSKIPNWGKMSENQKSAIYSFAYNLGAEFYGGSDFNSITNLLNMPDRWGEESDVLITFQKYRNPGTAAEEGLRRRRIAEARLFLR